MPSPLHLFAIAPEEIARVVHRFYARVRVHPVLGPVFAAHIEAADWPAHEEKIIRFWRNAILREQCYSGNPMRVHIEARDILLDHVPVWLRLFREVLDVTLDPVTAEAWAALAGRIGNGFRYGIEQVRTPPGAVPRLR